MTAQGVLQARPWDGATTGRSDQPEQLRGPWSPETWTGHQHDTEPHRRRSLEGCDRRLRPPRDATSSGGVAAAAEFVVFERQRLDQARGLKRPAATRAADRCPPGTSPAAQPRETDGSTRMRPPAPRSRPTRRSDPARAALRALSQRRDQLSACRPRRPPRRRRPCRPSPATSAPSSPTSPAALPASTRRSPSASRAIRRSAEDARLLRAIPGIGPVATTENPRASARGRPDRPPRGRLARGPRPRARESGKYKGRRSLGDGRRHLRRALYMAALSALRHDGFLPASSRG